MADDRITVTCPNCDREVKFTPVGLVRCRCKTVLHGTLEKPKGPRVEYALSSLFKDRAPPEPWTGVIVWSNA